MMQVLTRLSLAALALLMFALLPAPARAAESCSGEFVTYYLCGGDGVEETICDSGDPGARPVEETVTWSCPVRCGTGLRECRVYRDCDGDTWGADLVVNVGSCSSATRGGDCDDNPSSGASVNPGVAEICFDGIDNNCDGDLDEVLVDVDDDGSFVEILCRPEAPDADEDCNDNDDEVFPGNTEVCDGKDNDCNGEVDWFRFEECNGIDDDCDGVADSQDWDNDGAPYLACTPAAGDCHDGDPQVFPGRADFCGPIVPDCHYSTLGDGHCDLNCDGGRGGWLSEDICGDGLDNDCNGETDNYEPGILEVCDFDAEGEPVDNNCDGLANEPANFDGDPVDRPVCIDEYDIVADDCVDVKVVNGTFERGDLPGQCPGDRSDEECRNSAEIYPFAPENCDFVDTDCDGVADTYVGCDGLDNDCDDLVDEIDDVDADGVVGTGCDGNPLDTDETSSECGSLPQNPDEYYSGAASLVDLNNDGIPDCSQNCLRDESGICTAEAQCPYSSPLETAASVTLYSALKLFPTERCPGNSHVFTGPDNAFVEVPARVEMDVGGCGENWADLIVTNPVREVTCRYACDGNGYSFHFCDDGQSVPGTSLYATEVTLDTNLNLNSGPSIAYAELFKTTSDCDVTAIDADGDGHYPAGSCFLPADDCDPNNREVIFQCNCEDYPVDERPSLPESCDGFDNDCDGEIDEGVGVRFYIDVDNDRRGDALRCFTGCEGQVGDEYSSGASSWRYISSNSPDFLGLDCDDDTSGSGCGDCVDADGDGWPSGCLQNGKTDCDDSNPMIFPGAPEVCDGFDNDCDCAIDETTIEAGRECLSSLGENAGVCAAKGQTICRDGTIQCAPTEVAPPASENDVCGDGLDNNCSGEVDEGCSLVDCDGQNLNASACLPAEYVSHTLTTPPAGLGALPGEFSVDEFGAANYRIPIRVPAGRKGIEPRLAIVYNSQKRNGLLGFGFSLAGVSRIDRCDKNARFDGSSSAPTFTSSDAFCLDGSRLAEVDVTTACDGAQHEFRVTDYPFEPICRFGEEPAVIRFEWHRKDGTVTEFTRESSDSSIPERGAQAWYMTKVVDSHGNWMDVEYYSGVFAMPKKIRYTGGRDYAPTRALEFDMEARDDQYDRYEFGAHSTMTQRLSRVRILIDGEETRLYRLRYDYGRELSRLIAVDEEAEGAVRTTRFDWESQGVSWSKVDARNGCSTCGVPAPPGAGAARVADIDGDGVVELSPGFVLDDSDETVRFRYARLRLDGTVVRPNDGPRLGVADDEEPHPESCDSSDYICGDWEDYLINQWVDRGQDGKADWWIGEKRRDNFYIFSVNEAGETSVRAVPWNWRDFEHGATFGDFDGDGFTDLQVVDHRGKVRKINSVWNIESALNGNELLGNVRREHTAIAGNYDAEGGAEVAYVDNNDTSSNAVTIDGDPTQLTLGGGNRTDYQVIIGADRNGDGLMDIVNCLGNAQLTANGMPGTPLPFVPSKGLHPVITPNGLGEASVVSCAAADFNFDGEDTVVRRFRADSNSTTTQYDMLEGIEGGDAIQLQSETGFYGGFSPADLPPDFVLADLDGDGDPDLYYHDFNGDTAGPHVYVNNSKPNRVIGIRESFDTSGPATHQIEYATVRESTRDYPDGVYTPSPLEGECPPNLVCHPPRVDVVKRSSHLSGSEAETTTRNYRYGDGYQARNGQGFLGFGWRVVDEETTGRVHRFEYDNTVEGLGGFPQTRVVVREQHVFRTANSQSEVRTVERTPTTVPVLLSGASVDTYFTYASLIRDSEASAGTFSSLREELYSSPITLPTPYRVAERTQLYDGHGNKITESTRHVLNWSSADAEAPRAALEHSGTASVVTRSFDPYASESVKRRGQFAQVARSRSNSGCEYTRNPTGVTEPVAEAQSAAGCGQGAELGVVQKFTYTWRGDLETRRTLIGGVALSETEFAYSPSGNLVSKVDRDLLTPNATRTTTYTYDRTDGVSPFTTSNALGHTSVTIYDRRFGTPIFRRSADGLASSRTYDSFGRLRFEDTEFASSETRYSELAPAAGLPARVRIDRFYYGEADPRSTVYLDRQGRPVRQERVVHADLATNSRAVSFVEFSYDLDGNRTKTTSPALLGDVGHTYHSEYDGLGRMTRDETADGAVSYEFDGPKLYYSGVRSGMQLTGADGRVVAVRNSSSPDVTLFYYYAANGELLEVDHDGTAPEDRRLYFAPQDDYGRRRSVAVANLTPTVFRYSGFGEIVFESDSEGRTVFHRYDPLGRQISSTGLNTGSVMTDYDFGGVNSVSGVGRVARMESFDGIETRYEYDQRGLLARRVQNDRANLTAEWNGITHQYLYDERGRLEYEVLPKVPGWNDTESAQVHYVSHDLTDLPAEVWLEGRGGDPTRLMGDIGRDASGRVTTSSLGSGVSLNEEYSDTKFSFGRIEHVSFQESPSAAPMTVDMSWERGHLAEKSIDRGDGLPVQSVYNYADEQLSSTSSGLDFGTSTEFGVQDGLPDESFVTEHNGFQITKTSSNDFGYDPAGYLVVENERRYRFNDFGDPAAIEAIGAAQWTDVSFRYSADGDKVVIEDAERRLVRSGSYAVQYPLGRNPSPVEHRIDLGFAVVALEEQSSGLTLEDVRYLATDQVGSPFVVDGQFLSTPPHGLVSMPNRSFLLEPGFGGHYQLTAAGGLVDMRARLYDPATGRFISPDPYVPDLYNALSYNPYLYTYNDPGSLVDPTGEFAFLVLLIPAGKAAGTVVGGALALAVTGAVVGHLLGVGQGSGEDADTTFDFSSGYRPRNHFDANEILSSAGSSGPPDSTVPPSEQRTAQGRQLKREELRTNTRMSDEEIEEELDFLGYPPDGALRSSTHGSSRGSSKYPNLFPGDAPKPMTSRRLEQRGDKWVTIGPKGDVRTASGRYNFVSQDGKIYVGKRVKGGHIDLSQGEPVDYAGQIEFSGRTHRGTLRSWDNRSGHYKPDAVSAWKAGLPLDLFDGY